MKFCLRFLICSWIRATTLRRFFLFLVPSPALDNLRCARVKACSSLRKKRGFSICSPVERYANVFNPTSMPTSSSDSGGGSGSISSHEKLTYHFPVELLMMVQVLITPLGGRCMFIQMVPILARVSFAHCFAWRFLPCGAGPHGSMPKPDCG